mgnify:CR=1 FL=1
MLSVIQLSKENHNQAYAIDVLNQVIDGEDFNELAVKVSDDPSVLLNMGDWSFYSQDQFKYIFSTDVFSVKDLGVIPSVFETKEDYYLISVEEIIPPKDADFEEVCAIDPVVSMAAIDNDELKQVAGKVRDMLSEVVQAI